MMEDQKVIYSVGKPEETEDILDFANMVFSMTYNSIDFAKLLPKAYSAERCHIPVHHIMKEQNKIRGLVDVYPVTMKIDDLSIRAAYIGTVSVHPNMRGRGYLAKLMDEAEKAAVEQGFDLMILDGNRHRYMHYGFERAGIKYSFNIEKKNIAHCCNALYGYSYTENPVYDFEEVDEESPYIDMLYNLYMRRNMTARDKEDFLLCLQSSYAVTYAVINEQVVGYVNISSDENNILEFELLDNSELPKVIYDLMEGLENTRFGITVGADETRKIEYLEKMCDYCNASMSHQIKILNYSSVLRFLFKWKQKYDTLAADKYTIGISDNNECRNYCIEVCDNDVTVKETDNIADAVFEKEEFVRTFTTSFYLIQIQKGSESKLKNMPQGWLPLPFYLPDADAF